MTERLRPQFIEELSAVHYYRRKNVIVLSGNVNDIFYTTSRETFVSLEYLLNDELKNLFTVLGMDMSVGVSMFDNVHAISNGSKLDKLMQNTRHNPLAALVLMKDLFERSYNAGSNSIKTSTPLPICSLIKHAGSLFPAGDMNRLPELDRQRLVFFLSWVSDPLFQDSKELIILINRVKSEVNSEILALPNVAHIEIPLPDELQREVFILGAVKDHSVEFEGGIEKLHLQTAGLTIHSIKDLVEISRRQNRSISREDVLEEVNIVFKTAIGDIARIKRPKHSPKDIIGYASTRQILTDVFKRCDDPEIAISAILVSGPNGVGKTFQLEAYATQTNRIVLELIGIRDSLFGGTDKLFEQLRWYLITLGNALILIDEAHTELGGIHSSDTHKTEKRLQGNIIKLMGDPSLRGKILWALMTSRPDELDPDVKSRASIQIPIFDLEGDERRVFVKSMLLRSGNILSDDEVYDILNKTKHFSARDYEHFIREVKASQRLHPGMGPVDVLGIWQASRSIEGHRRYQTLVAAQHCSYPALLPAEFKEHQDEIPDMIDDMKLRLQL